MKKLVCLLLALVMLLSLTACPDVDYEGSASSSGITDTESSVEGDGEQDKKPSSKDEISSRSKPASNDTSASKDTSSKNKDTSSNQRPTASESGGILDIINPPKSESSEPEHEHKYEKTVVVATCGKGGYEKYTCDCGHSYKENVVGPTYKHEFKEDWIVGESMWYPGFGCTKCGLKVLDMEGRWNDYVKTDKVRWYVTGTKVEKANGDFSHDADLHIVVCGKGAIEDYESNNGSAPWYRYVNKYLKKITIAEGITTIGEYAFYSTVKEKRNVEFDIADSVKTIKKCGISLNLNELPLGKGVEVIERGGIGSVSRLYLPKSLKTYYNMGNEVNTVCYYEGDLDSLLKIQVEYYVPEGVLDSKKVIGSYKECCNYYFERYPTKTYFNIVVLNSSKIKRGDSYFNGKEVVTDRERLSAYVK